MSTFYGSAAHIEGGAVPGLDGEDLDGCGRADDVNDGVFRADLVKVDEFSVTIVNFGLGLGEKFESLEGKGLGSGADRGPGDDLANLFQTAVEVDRRKCSGVRVSVGMIVGVRVLVMLVAMQRRGRKVERLVRVSLDEDVDFVRGDAGALDATGDQLSVESESAGDGL